MKLIYIYIYIYIQYKDLFNKNTYINIHIKVSRKLKVLKYQKIFDYKSFIVRNISRDYLFVYFIYLD